MEENYKFEEEAEQDLSDAFDWYESKQSGVGDKFVKNVFEKIESITQNPYSYPVHHDQYRKASIRKFPYSLFYLIQPTFYEIYKKKVLKMGKR